MLALAVGCVLDLLLGDPEWLYHPVRLIGNLITAIERRLRKNNDFMRLKAVALTASVVAITMGCVWLFLGLLRGAGRIPWLIGMCLLDWMGLAARSMYDEARGVERALDRGLREARARVGRIVGRDTDELTREEIIKATVETVAENTTDGVISPMIFAALGGPVALWGFKAASTLDSMVGYLDERFKDIGWGSARLDDVLNYLPARLTALLMVCAAYLTGLDGKNAFRITKRDHARHRSPNCAWSEAAAAGALHIGLGGTHMYFGKPVEKPTIGDPDREPEPGDIKKACGLLFVSAGLCMLIFIIVFLAAK